MKDLISLHDLTSEEVKGLLELGLKLKKEQKSGIEHHILKGKTLGMIFTKSSTRTRVSFEVGTLRSHRKHRCARSRSSIWLRLR